MALNNIRLKGLIPASQLKNTNGANPDGSYNSDRDKNFDKKLKMRIRSFIKKGFSLNAEEMLLTQCQFDYDFPDFNPQDNRDQVMEQLSNAQRSFDHVFLTRLKQEVLLAARAVSQPTGKETTSILSEKQRLDLAVEQHFNDKCSEIYIFSAACLELAYQVEANQTAKHIYFFRKKDAKDFYRSYTPYHGGEQYCYVLRVLERQVSGLKQDMGDYRGVMTMSKVPPEQIDIYFNSAKPNPFEDEAQDIYWKKLCLIDP